MATAFPVIPVFAPRRLMLQLSVRGNFLYIVDLDNPSDRIYCRIYAQYRELKEPRA
jgi:hypothetical protein